MIITISASTPATIVAHIDVESISDHALVVLAFRDCEVTSVAIRRPDPR